MRSKILEEKCSNLELNLERTQNALFEKEKELEKTFQSFKEKDNSNSRLYLEENQKLRRDIEALEAKAADDNQQTEVVTQDCQKLAALYTELEEQLETERLEKEEIAKKYLTNIESLERELTYSKTKQTTSSIRDMEKFTQQKKRFEDESIQLNTLNSQLNNEVSELNKLLFQKERESIQYLDQNENLRKENNRLRTILRQEITQKDNSYPLKKSLNEAEKELSKYKMELNRLNHSLQESNIDLGINVDRSEL